MIFPIGDNQVKGGAYPYVTHLFIGLNVLIFLFEISLGPNLQGFIYEYGSIPQEIQQGEDLFTLLTSIFLHGGWMHLIGNMLFLWVFGDNIEATVGNFVYLLFYIGGGLFASLAHTFFNLGSMIPSVGASGSISAILGAYVIMFPHSKIKLLVLIFFRSFRVAAIYFLGFWIVQQLFSGVGAMSETADSTGVAWWAHIGGFVFGLAIGLFFRMRYPIELKVDKEHLY